jgi:hydrogenase maturation protein HypF
MDDLPPVASCSATERQVMQAMIARGINSPLTSSAGRLFDAVASLAGIRQQVRYEGQAAMELEFALEGIATDERYPLESIASWKPGAGSREPGAVPWRIDWAPMIRTVVDDVRSGCAVGVIAARFHNAMAEVVVEVARRVRLERVVLSGGCFQNRYLLERAVARLEAEGFRPAWPQRVPPNDGGIALGQVVAVRWGFTQQDDRRQ